MPTATGHISEPLQSVEDWLVSGATWQATFDGTESRNLCYWAANESALRDDWTMFRPYAVIALANHSYRLVSEGPCSGLLANGLIVLYLTRNATYPDSMKDSYTDFTNWAGTILGEMVETTPPHVNALELRLIQRVMPAAREEAEYDFWEIEYGVSYGG